MTSEEVSKLDEIIQVIRFRSLKKILYLYMRYDWDNGWRHLTRNNKVNILYKTGKPFKDVLTAKCKNRAIGPKKTPSWEKICFQLGKLFFPTGNLKLGGYRKNLLFHPYFTIVRQDRHQPYTVKSFDIKKMYQMIHLIIEKSF